MPDRNASARDPHATLADAWKKFILQIDGIKTATDKIAKKLKSQKPSRTER